METDKHLQRDQAIEKIALWTRVKFHADSNSVKTRRVSSGILPCVRITNFRHVDVDRTPTHNTSVQRSLFTSEERTQRAWLKTSTAQELHCHLCALEKSI